MNDVLNVLFSFIFLILKLILLEIKNMNSNIPKGIVKPNDMKIVAKIIIT